MTSITPAPVPDLVDMGVAPNPAVASKSPRVSADNTDKSLGSQRGDDSPSLEAPSGVDENPIVVVPPVMPLTSTVTYSDLPGGYDDVALVIAPDSSHDVFPSSQAERLLENPDSIAVLVVSPDPSGDYRPDIAITHQKLRYLFKDAIGWYLRERGANDDAVRLSEFVRSDEQGVARRRTPLRIAQMRVRATGYDFYTPAPDSAYKPSTGNTFFGLLILAIMVASAVELYCFLHAIGGRLDARILNVIRLAYDTPLHVNRLVRRLALLALKGVGVILLRLDRALAIAREVAQD